MTFINQQISNLTLQYNDYFARGLYANALDVARKLLIEVKDTSNNEELAVVYVKLMHCYYSLGEIENVFEMVTQFKAIYEENKTKKLEYYHHLIYGYIYDYEENFDSAIQSIKHALSIALKLNANWQIAISRNLYAHLLLKNSQAELGYKQAIQNMEFITKYLPSNLLIQCQCQHILATTQIETNQLDEALLILDQLSKNPIISYNKKERSRYFFAKATYYQKIKAFEEAIQYFKKSEEIAFQNNDIMPLKRIYKNYSHIYAQLNNYKLAYFHLQNYTHLVETTCKSAYVSKVRELDYKHHALHYELRANIDSLSTLYNRSYIEQTVNSWLSTAKKEKTHVCVIVFDVDDFKTINDTHGHLYGDEVIKHIGKCCKTVFSDDSALCARYGGDEFVIALRNFGHDNVREAAVSLYNEITKTSIQHEDVTINISISMGVVCNDSIPATRFTQLFRVADQALYSAKKQGKAQIVAMTNQSCAYGNR